MVPGSLAGNAVDGAPSVAVIAPAAAARRRTTVQTADFDSASVGEGPLEARRAGNGCREYSCWCD